VQPGLGPLWEWYEVQRDLIVDEKMRAQSVLSGALPAALVTPTLAVRYLAMTREDLVEFFTKQAARLDLVIMLELLATAEGALRFDFRDRVVRREKDPISREFRNFAKRHGEKIRFDEHILQVWKGFDKRAKNAVGDFRGALKLRHWLAHGRHWTPKLGRPYTPNDIFDIATELLNAVGAARD
jgi:hypothetical protein